MVEIDALQVKNTELNKKEFEQAVQNVEWWTKIKLKSKAIHLVTVNEDVID